jgi:ribonuclease HI
MELMAIIQGLSALRKPCNNVTLFTDSQYVVKAINEGWLHNWISNDWRKSDKKPVLNVDLWKQVVALLSQHNVKFIWIEGHTGVYGNERCDSLCRAAAEQGVEVDFVYESMKADVLI